MQFGQMIVTKKGLALQAKVQAGKLKLVFTKVKTGSGRVSDPSELLSLDAMVEERQVLQVNDVRVLDDATTVVEAILSNRSLTEGYYLSEIGIFAEDEGESEVLYAIVNFNDQVDYVPTGAQRQLDMVLNLQTIVSNVEKLEVRVEYSMVFVTKQEFRDLAGEGRTTENVKKNADDILGLAVEVAALKGATLNNISGNTFAVKFTELEATEEFRGYWNRAVGQLEV